MRASFAGRDRKLIPVLLGFVVLTVCALAQDLPTGKPESLGLSAERLGRTLDLPHAAAFFRELRIHSANSAVKSF